MAAVRHSSERAWSAAPPASEKGRAEGLTELEIGIAAFSARASWGAICFNCSAPISEACWRSRAASLRGTAARAKGELKPGPLPFSARLTPANTNKASIAATSGAARRYSRSDAGTDKAGSFWASAVIRPPDSMDEVPHINNTALLQPEAPPGRARDATQRCGKVALNPHIVKLFRISCHARPAVARRLASARSSR